MADFDMPPASAGFDVRGGWLIRRLLSDARLQLSNVIHPAAIVGNLGGESRLTAIQEVSPIAGRGGFGWEQATGDRRRNFEAFAAAHGMKVTDDEANYEFLVSELLGSENRAFQRLKLTTTLEAAVYTFEVLFERPSSTSDVSARVKYAQRAIAAMAPLNAEDPRPEPEAPALPPAATIAQHLGTPDALNLSIRLVQTILSIADYYSGPVDGRPNDAMYAGLETYRAWLDSQGAKP